MLEKSSLIPPQIKVHSRPDPKHRGFILKALEVAYDFDAEGEADSYVEAVA